LRYAAPDLALEASGATVTARKRGDRLTIDVSMALDSLQAQTADLSETKAKLTADLPYPDLAKGAVSGPLEARLTLRAEDGRLGDAKADGLSGDIAMTGRLDGGLDHFAFLGKGRAALRGERLSAPSLDARRRQPGPGSFPHRRRPTGRSPDLARRGRRRASGRRGRRQRDRRPRPPRPGRLRQSRPRRRSLWGQRQWSPAGRG
jgi:hypothetical protein